MGMRAHAKRPCEKRKHQGETEGSEVQQSATKVVWPRIEERQRLRRKTYSGDGTTRRRKRGRPKQRWMDCQPRHDSQLSLSAEDPYTIHNIVTASIPGRKRLQFRYSISEHATKLTSDAHGKINRACPGGNWETRRDPTRCPLRDVIPTLSNKPMRHDLSRHSLVRGTCMITGYGRFEYNKKQVALSPSASCVCAALQAIPHTARPASVRYTHALGNWWYMYIGHCSTVTYSTIMNQTQEPTVQFLSKWDFQVLQLPH